MVDDMPEQFRECLIDFGDSGYVERAAEARRAAGALRAQEEALAAREAALERREVDIARQAEWLERGAGNLQVAMRMAVSGRHNREIVASDMADDPEKFETLRRSAPDGRPTWGGGLGSIPINFS